MRHKRFVCDCMCCGAAKCIRAWGYYAYWEYGIKDRNVVKMALEKNMIAVTSDSGILERNVFTENRARAVFVPVGLSRWEQFETVLHNIDNMPRRKPRCMSCGGKLRKIEKKHFKDQLPEKTYKWLDEFYKCENCGKFFWEGTHWESISRHLDRIEADHTVYND